VESKISSRRTCDGDDVIPLYFSQYYLFLELICLYSSFVVMATVFDTNVYRAHFEFLSLVVRIYFFQVFISVSLHRLVYYFTHIFLTWNKSCIYL